MLSFKKYIDHNYSTSSFITGLGSVFNIYGSYYKFNYSRSSSKDDQHALKSDWDSTGEDIFDAMRKHSQKLKKYVSHRRKHPFIGRNSPK